MIITFQVAQAGGTQGVSSRGEYHHLYLNGVYFGIYILTQKGVDCLCSTQRLSSFLVTESFLFYIFFILFVPFCLVISVDPSLAADQFGSVEDSVGVWNATAIWNQADLTLPPPNLMPLSLFYSGVYLSH